MGIVYTVEQCYRIFGFTFYPYTISHYSRFSDALDAMSHLSDEFTSDKWQKEVVIEKYASSKTVPPYVESVILHRYKRLGFLQEWVILNTNHVNR